MSTATQDRQVDQPGARHGGAGSRGAPPRDALEPAKTPLGLGPVPVIGAILSLLTIALGVVALHDALLRAGAVGGSEWIGGAASRVDGWTPQPWMAIVGAATVLLGLWLVYAALRPRPRTVIALTAQTGVFLTRRGLERVAVNAASDVSGVLSAAARASRHRLDVRVSITGGSSTTDSVRTAVEEALSPLESRPVVRVKSSGGRT